MRVILILHPFGAALSLQSIKAVVLETRERLDAQARAKMDLFASQIDIKVVQVFAAETRTVFSPLPYLSFLD